MHVRKSTMMFRWDKVIHLFVPISSYVDTYYMSLRISSKLGSCMTCCAACKFDVISRRQRRSLHWCAVRFINEWVPWDVNGLLLPALIWRRLMPALLCGSLRRMITTLTIWIGRPALMLRLRRTIIWLGVLRGRCVSW